MTASSALGLCSCLEPAFLWGQWLHEPGDVLCAPTVQICAGTMANPAVPMALWCHRIVEGHLKIIQFPAGNLPLAQVAQSPIQPGLGIPSLGEETSVKAFSLSCCFLSQFDMHPTF